MSINIIEIKSIKTYLYLLISLKNNFKYIIRSYNISYLYSDKTLS